MQRHTTSINFHQSTLDVWMIGLTGSPIIGIHSIRVWLRYAQHPICSIYVLAYPKCHLSVIRKRDRQKQPGKIHQKKKTHNKIKKQKPQKQSWQVLIILCFPSLFFFLCALVLYFLNRYILYAVRLKSLVYKKDQNKLLTVIFGPREKEESKMYERKGGQAHPSLEYIFWISGFDMIRH